MSEDRGPDRSALLAALEQVREPALGQDLVSADLVRQLDLQDSVVDCTLAVISPALPYRERLEEQVREALASVPGVTGVILRLHPEVPSDGRTRGLVHSPIRNAIAVASGKGGVGKSTVAVNLAAALAGSGGRVGLLDADVYGPNVPTMLGVERMPPPREGRMAPAEAFGIKVMSIAFLVKPGQPLIWRGPMLHTAIRQFISDVDWGELDYLIVDLPPGTGDAPLSLTQSMPLSGAVIVTMPQKVSVEDASRGLAMFQTMNVDVFGVIENMSFLELPGGERVDVFGQGGGGALARAAGVPFLGSLPLDPHVREAGDSGVPFVIAYPDTPAAQAMVAIASELSVAVGVAALQQGTPVPIQIID